MKLLGEKKHLHWMKREKLFIHQNIVPNKESIEKIIKQWIGETEQMPPQYSAKKINGERSYNLARKNIHVELKKQKIKFIIFVLLIIRETNFFFVTCGNGSM